MLTGSEEIKNPPTCRRVRGGFRFSRAEDAAHTVAGLLELVALWSLLRAELRIPGLGLSRAVLRDF